ncbi:MAG TPA: DUF1592 domain-containing protein [Polyangiaceae bacterium]
MSGVKSRASKGDGFRSARTASERVQSAGRWALVFLLAVACGASRRSSDPDDEGAGGTAPMDEPGAGEAGDAGRANSSGGSNRAGSSNDAGRSNTAGTASAGSSNGDGGSSVGGSNGDGGSSAASGSSSGGGAGQPDRDPDCEEGIPVTSQTLRLTNEHYDRTVRDLLGLTELDDGEPPSSLLLPNRPGTMTEPELEGYRAAAAAIAAKVVTDETMRAAYLACEPTDEVDACWRDTIVGFGRRAFRRPLTDMEVTSFETLVAATAAVPETSSVDAIAEALLSAFLVSPSFLFRVELSAQTDEEGNLVLSSHEVATRLSYLLWGSLPDVTLDVAADAGELATKEQILNQAERMLADERARERVAEFHRFYLNMGPQSYWANSSKDELAFPLYDETVSALLLEETELFFDGVAIEARGSFQDLFSSPLAFVNSATAPLYGLDPNEFGSELVGVRLDPAQRPGFLTRAGFLSTHSGFDRTSPIRRGLFITNSVLGIDVPDAEPSATDPPPLPEMYLTNREYTTSLTASPACQGCHVVYIDPPGFVLENYDAIGAWQTHEADTGAPIDPVADVLIDDVPVTVVDSADLMRRLAASRDAQRTYVESWIRFGYERNVDPLDECTVEKLSYEIARGGYPILALLSDLTQTDAFRLRRSTTAR